MKTYIAYIRVSTAKQGEHGSSLQEQRSAIEAYAAKHGLTISGWYKEMETAAKLGRTVFNRMLADLTKGSAVGVIIHKIDRSARNLKDWAHLGELIDLGLEVHFAHESLDLASRGGRLAADIQAVVAADYIRNLRQEVLKGFYGRLKQGYYPLPAPRGYLDQGKAKPKIIDPVNGPLIRQAFELYASGRYSLPTLVIEMQRRGLRSKTGGRLPLASLSRILHSPFYIGLIRIDRTQETYQGIHEPLVSVKTFERVQAIMAGRTFARPQRHDPLFRRMLRCAGCGRMPIGEKQKGHIYYRCHSTTCRGTSIREDFLIDDVRAFFDALRLSDEELRDLREFVDGERTKDRAALASFKIDQKRLLGLCEGKIARLTDAFLDGSIEKDLFEERKASLFTERRSLLDVIQAPAEEIGNFAVLKKLELGNTAYIDFESENIGEIREKLKLTNSNLELRGKELVFTPQFPFSEVIKSRYPLYGAPYGDTPRNEGLFCALRIIDGRTTWLKLSARSGIVPGEPFALLRYLSAPLPRDQTLLCDDFTEDTGRVA